MAPDLPSDQNERARLRELEVAATALILSRRGWEVWGSGHFLYDRTEGHGEGRVYSMAEALVKIGGKAARKLVAPDEEEV